MAKNSHATPEKPIFCSAVSVTWKHTLNFYFYMCDGVAMRNLCNPNFKNKVRETFTFLDGVQGLYS